ncbi:class F sortase [Jatrophihabitans telluris]|uniref:Class F sortase n=1 Tax=Jatrophihabitans telluris TaxID=2038343 RepID=A0ABY4R2M4_9ACTN|nr:class F sortase [Jatrophihabitans telluris]UQX89416.1 class F sortase [Jatrophihabitans telluris]
MSAHSAEPSGGRRPGLPTVGGIHLLLLIAVFSGLVALTAVMLFTGNPQPDDGASTVGMTLPALQSHTPTIRPLSVSPDLTTSAGASHLSETPLTIPVAPPTVAPARPGLPVLVSVPRLQIRSSLQALGLLSDGTLQAPTEYARAGWYAKGIRPGAVGPAIIAGHVDSVSGPAVFFALSQARVGDDVVVTDDRGATRHFTVVTIARYAKASFPTDAVYGPSPLPVVRLITCTGDFDVSKGSYLDNLVVTAELRRPRAG